VTRCGAFYPVNTRVGAIERTQSPARPLQYIAAEVVVVLTLLVAIAASGEGSTFDQTRRWSDNVDQVPLFVCENGTGREREALMTAASFAATAWNDIGAGPQIEVVGSGPCSSVVEYDGVNRVGFERGDWPFRQDACGLTGLWRDSASGAILEADVALNLRMPLAAQNDHGDHTYDLWSVMIHELGHALGLADVDDDPEATMFYLVKEGETQKRDLTTTDEDQLIQLYAGVAPVENCSGVPPSSVMGIPLALLLRRPKRNRAGAPHASRAPHLSMRRMQ
jgi:hypothetical protein